MNIRVEIKGTEPGAPEGTYVYDSGPVGGRDIGNELQSMNKWILHSLAAMRKLQVKT